jgi:cysteine desulfurase/selenocysteine lyase
MREMRGVEVFLDHEDLTKRDLILGIGFEHIDCTQAVVEYARRGVTVYERVATSLYSKRMLESFGLAGTVRVSPLHCNSVADMEKFLRITNEIAAQQGQ